MTVSEAESGNSQTEASTSSFLRRWSERKVRTRESAEPVPQAEPISPPPAQELTDADMPPLDSLDEHSDYRCFFSPKVSEALRRQALRKLFHSPRFNVTDGLDVYQEDYTCFAGLGDIITQDLRHQLEVEAKRLARSLSEAPPPDKVESASAGSATDPARATPGET